MKRLRRHNLKRPRALSRRGTRPLKIEPLEDRSLLSVSLVAGQLRVVDGCKVDTVTVRAAGAVVTVTENGRTSSFPATAVTNAYLNLGGGNDRADLSGVPFPVTAYLGSGNDTYIGGEAADTVWGGDGNDSLNGRGGNDALYGEGGVDVLIGGPGKDYLFGGYPGAVDTIYGNPVMAGQPWDTIYNPRGQDRVYLDTTDPGPQPVVVTRIDQQLDSTGAWLSQASTVKVRLVAPADGLGRPVVNVWLDGQDYGEHRFGARWVIRTPSPTSVDLPQDVRDAFAAANLTITLETIRV